MRVNSNNLLPGIHSFITGNPRTKTAATKGSRTQKRKAALATYSADERRFGRRTGASQT